MTPSRRILTLGFALVSAACTRDRDPVSPEPAPADETVAWLAVSADRAARGDTVTVLARARDKAGVGSFAATLRYDATRYRLLGAVELGGMRALNGNEAGVVRVAGADPAGFADHRLFGVRFVALADGPVNGLSLEIGELSGVDYGDRTPRLSLQPRLAVEEIRD